MSAPKATVSAGDVERAGRVVAFARWGVASIAMVGSMIAGGCAFDDLHEPAVFGVLIAFAADIALTSWLLVGSWLQALDIRLMMGVVLEGVCGAQSVFLNVGAVVFKGMSGLSARLMLAIAHSFVPVLMVLVSLAGGEAYLRLVRLRREREAAEKAQRATEQRQREDTERRRANGELVDAQAVFDRAQELRRAAGQETRRLEEERQEAARVRAEAEAEAAATQAVREKLAVPQPPASVSHARRRTTTKTKVSVEARLRWVLDWYADNGELPPGPRVDKEFGTTRCGYRIVNMAAAKIAEEKRRALHALTGGRQ